MKTDLELIQEVKNGEKSSFEQLVERHQKFLLKVAIRMTRDLTAAEDVVQESFIKAYRRLSLFEGRASFRSWMYQITINTARNRLRSGGRETVGLDNVQMSTEGELDRNLMEADVKNIIQAEISLLPGRQREALTLRIYDDLSFKEIAHIMNCPYDTAKANYRHALLKLRERLSDHASLQSFSTQPNLALTEFGVRQMEVDG